MGVRNVNKIFVYWRHLEHRDKVALCFMALTALDADEPPVFWGKWESLAEALGHDAQDAPDNARRATTRALTSLKAAGAIVSTGEARPGVHAEYALCLDPAFTFSPFGKGRDISWFRTPRSVEVGTSSVPRTRDVQRPRTLDVQCPKGGTPNVLPRTEPNEELKKTGEESTSVELLTHQGGSIENDSIDEISPSPSKADRIRLDTKAEIEDEKRRQLDALEKLIREQKEVA